MNVIGCHTRRAPAEVPLPPPAGRLENPNREFIRRMMASARKKRGVMPLDLGLGLQDLYEMTHHFQLVLPDWNDVAPPRPPPLPERMDLWKLLHDHRSVTDREARWMATIIVTGCQGPDHLWSDLGMENREQLSRLMMHDFFPLASSNTMNMKWKKFLYRRLCQREGLSLCPSPSCQECSDFPRCFAPEAPS
ncbi:MAG: nitrogen fixation protein NifQ [Magnetococcales bacterium]|nr:nitrogen fixation protein NifQ [Magnetococcales bacterium]